MMMFNTLRRIPIWFALLIALGLLALGGVVYYLLRPLEGPVPANAGAGYVNLEKGTTEDGFARLGSPDAPILVEEFSSYACPHCRTFHEEQLKDLLQPIADGKVQYVVIPMPNIGSGAKNAAQAALCAGQQGKYWEMHDTLFDWQHRFITSVFDPRRLEKGAGNLGLDTAAFKACLNSDWANTMTDRALQEFRHRQLTGTPTFFINGQRVQDYREFENLGKDS